MVTYFEDYLYSIDLQTINNAVLSNTCLSFEKFLLEFTKSADNTYGTFTTSQHDNYNLLTYPCIELNKLYHEIRKNICPYLEKKTFYMLKSWLNVYRVGQRIDWHNHWEHNKGVWHGFYCVQVGNSFTSYRIPESQQDIVVPSVDGRLVFGKSDGDQHRSSVWEDISMPRITIAFDIIPIESITQLPTINHFIPL